MAKDFFDDDLVRPDVRAPGPTDEDDGVSASQVADLSPGRLARQKEELTDQVANRARELEELRLREEELQREKRDLEGLKDKQQKYEAGKVEVTRKLERGVLILDKEEKRSARTVELLSVLRGRFNDALAELGEINEETWTHETFQVDLNRAIVLVEDAKAIYAKAVAKTDAVRWDPEVRQDLQPESVDRLSHELAPEKGFGFWLKVGVAVSLPLMVFLTALFVLWAVVSGIWVR